MAITAGELSILLTAKDQMTKVLKGAQNEMENTEKQGSALSKAFGLISKGAAIAGTAALGAGIALTKMALDAAPIAGVRDAFQGISGDADTMLAALQKGSAGMVSQAELMKTYNSAAQLVSKTFADDLPNAMGFLGKVSAATGEDMGFMLDSLVKGVGRLSPMILDNLGIQVDLVAANEAYAAQLGITTSEMTKSEQQAAIMAQVMQKLEENTAAMPEVLGSAAQEFASLQAQIADAKQEMGEAFLPVVLELLKQLRPLADVLIQDLVPALEKLVPHIITVVEAIALMPGALETTADATKPFKKQLEDAFIESRGVVTDEIQKMIDAEAELADRTGYHTNITAEDIRAMAEDVQDSLIVTKEELGSVEPVLKDANDALHRSAAEWEGWAQRGGQSVDDLVSRMEQGTPRIQDHLANMRQALEDYQNGVAESVSVHGQGITEMQNLQEEERLRNSAEVAQEYIWLTEGMYDKLGSVAQDGQMALLALTEKWGEETLAVTDAALAELLAATDNAALDQALLLQDRNTQLGNLTAEYLRDMSVMEGVASAESIQDRRAAYDQEFSDLQSQFGREDSLSDRARLISQVKQNRAQIIELMELRKHYLKKMTMMVVQAGLEANLEKETIINHLTNMGLVIDAETQLAIDHAKINQARLLSDQAYAKGAVDTLKSLVDAQIKVRANSLEEAKSQLDAWRPPDIKLPDIGLGDIGGGKYGLGGAGVGAAIGGALEGGEIAVEEVTQTVGRIVKSLDDAIQTLRDYQTAEGLGESVDLLIADSKIIGDKLIAYFEGWDQAAIDSANAAGKAADALATVLGPMLSIVQVVTAVGKFGKDAAAGFEEIQSGIDLIFISTEAILGMLQVLVPDWEKLAEDIKKGSADIASAVAPIVTLVKSVLSLEKFATDTAVGFEGIQSAIDLIFIATEALLGMLQVLVPAWAETAAEIKTGSADIAAAVKPISTMASAVLAIEEFGNKSADAWDGLLVGIDHTFAAVGAILAMLRVLVPAWAETAKDIKQGSADVAAAIKPIAVMADAVLALEEFGNESADAWDGLLIGIDHTFAAVGAILAMLRVLVPAWAETAAEIKQGSADVAAAIKPIAVMADAVLSLEEFGNESADAWGGLLIGIDQTFAAVGAILAMLRVLVPAWAETAKDIKEGSADVAAAINPIAVMADAVLALEEFGNKSADAWDGLLVGIDQTFAAVGAILAMLRVLVPAWAETAKDIKQGSADVAAAISPIAMMADAVLALEEFGNKSADAWDGLLVGIDHTFAAVGAILAMLRVLVPAWAKTAEEIKQGSADVAAAISPIAAMADAVLALEEFGSKTAEGFAGVQMAIDHTFAAVGAILAMLRVLVPAWALTAKEIKQGSADVASAVSPIAAMADAVRALEKFGAETAEGFGGVQMAIDHTFAAVGAILAMLRVLVPAWAKTAAEIKEGSADIASAVSPLSAMASAVAALEELGETTAEGFGGVQMAIDHAFVATGAILAMLRVLVPAWAETAKEIKEGSADIGAAVAPFTSMIDALLAITNIDQSKYKSPSVEWIEQIADDAVTVLETVFVALGILTDDVDALTAMGEAQAGQASLVSSALGVVNSMLGLNALDEYKSPDLTKVTLIAEDAVDVLDEVFVALGSLTDDTKALTAMSAAQEGQASLVSSALGIINDMLGLDALNDYVSPDLTLIALIAKDAMDVVDKVKIAVEGMWTSAKEMAPKIVMLETVAGMVSTVKSTIQDTITVAQALVEMSWREVKQHQVDSFTKNLANIVLWLTDPVSGIAAIKGLTDMAGYATAAKQLGTITTAVVVAIREVMTLPAVWDARLTVLSTGMAAFMTVIATAIKTEGQALVGAWEQLGKDIYAGMAAVLNDGAWKQLGARNATAYEEGWKAALGIASKSKVMMEMGKNAREGFDIGANGGSVTNNYELNVTTTQPAVNLVGSYRMLEAMG